MASSLGAGDASAQIYQHRPAALGRDRPVQLVEESISTEDVQNRETLPCAHVGRHRGALGSERPDGAHRVGVTPSRAARRTDGAPGSTGCAVPRTRRAGPLGRARRTNGSLATGLDELRRKLPPAAQRDGLGRSLPAPRGGSRPRSRLARAVFATDHGARGLVGGAGGARPGRGVGTSRACRVVRTSSGRPGRGQCPRRQSGVSGRRSGTHRRRGPAGR